MFRSFLLLVGGLASLSAVPMFAQDPALGQKYGYGVHAYFSGDYPKAYEQLTAAIQVGSKDPRVFYFRGLAYLQLGRGPEAAQDFQQGADLESKDTNKFYNVSKALERVQGAPRVELENYRVHARMALYGEEERLRKARYEAIQREESRVVREQSAGSPETIKTPEPAAAPTAEPADPFAGTEENSAPKAVKKPSKPTKKPAAEKAAAEKPAAEPAETKKPAAAPAAATEDPFAGPVTKPAEKTEAAKPSGDDPFAAEPAKPADKAKAPATEKKPAEAKKPVEEKNPAEKKPAEKKAATDDPFAT
jgi:tetratricopeptide (TPR) repeat protein